MSTCHTSDRITPADDYLRVAVCTSVFDAPVIACAYAYARDCAGAGAGAGGEGVCIVVAIAVVVAWVWCLGAISGGACCGVGV